MKNFKKGKSDSKTWGVLGKQETYYAPTHFMGEKVPLNANPTDAWDYKKSRYRRVDLVPKTDGQQAGAVPQGTATPTPTPSSTPVTPTPTPTNTSTPTPSATSSSVTPTPTSTSTSTPTPTITSTSTSTPTPTITSTSTPTPTLTPTPSSTPVAFKPSNLSNLQLWFDSTSGASVSSWTNYGLLGGSASQGTSTRQPALVSGTLGSYTGQALNFTSRDNMTIGFASTNFSAMTAFLVIEQTSNTDQYGIFGPVTYQVYGSPSLIRISHSPSTITLSQANSSTLSSQPVLFISSGDTSAFDAELLAGSLGTFTGTKSADSSGVSLTSMQFGTDPGVTTNGNFNIYEHIVYNRKLNSTEYNQVVNYLKSKYQYSTW